MSENINHTSDQEEQQAVETEQTTSAAGDSTEPVSEEPETTKVETSPKSEKQSKQDGQGNRKRRHRIFSIASVCLVLVAVIAVNLFATLLTNRFSLFTADMTTSKAFDISGDSVKLAQSLNKKVSLIFLKDKMDYIALDDYCKQAVSTADQLAMNSNGMLTVQFQDLVKNPTLENEYEGENLASTDVIVRCGDKYNIVTKEDMFQFETYSSSYQYISASHVEQAFDTAILKVTSDVVTNVALIANHAGDEYAYLEKVLNSNNYLVTEIDIEKDPIPENTDTVIAFAPTEDYSKEAVVKLMDFLNNHHTYGKNLLYVAHENQTDTPNIDSMLNEYGMRLGNGLAFEADSTRVLSSENNYDLIAATMASELYTDGFQEDTYPILVTRARNIISAKNDVTIPLLQYSDQSGVCPYDADPDSWNMYDAITGNIVVMAQGLAGTEDAVSSVVVCGSAIMWNRTFLQSQYSNRQYLLNMMATLNGRSDAQIQVADKVITRYDLNMNVSQKIAVGIVMYAVLPVLILAAGLVVYIVRRRK